MEEKRFNAARAGDGKRVAELLDPHEMKLEWFKAARAGDDKRVAELLAEQPSLIEVELLSNTALHSAAHEGHEAVVARLLAARPALFHAKDALNRTALDLAASRGHDKMVTQMLDTTDVVGFDISFALHKAVKENHDKVVDLLLAARSPNFTFSDSYAAFALYDMINKREVKNFTRLLAICPSLVNYGGFGTTALFRAANHGCDDMVSQLLALRPQLIDEVSTGDGSNVLMFAVARNHQRTAEMLLAIKPELISHVSKRGDTVLHQAVRNCIFAETNCKDDLEFVVKVWRLNPQALTQSDNIYHSSSPFHLVVHNSRFPDRKKTCDELIEQFQWSLSFDYIVSVFTRAQIDWQEKFRPVMEQLLSESLFESLNRDVVGTVLEYVGIDVVKRVNKRTTPQPHTNL